MTGSTIKKPRENLTEKVIAEIKAKIEAGELKAGDKLPTEPNMIKEYGVSRTVIREAVASLKADGLAEPKHGVGVFIRTPPTPQNELNLLLKHSDKISDTIEALELRTAVEIESAALAATRCSPGQEAEIFDCYYEFENKIKQGENTEKEDFDFHVAIAKATNNQHFVEFLTLVGRKTIPRARLREEAGLPREPEVEQGLNAEHREILDAIMARDPERARDAMRAHLSGGSMRYRALARAAQQKKASDKTI